jgi:hypothetical protein
LVYVVFQALREGLLSLSLLLHQLGMLDVVGEGTLAYLIMAPALQSLLTEQISLATLRFGELLVSLINFGLHGRVVSA